MYYSDAPEKMRNNYEQLKTERQILFLKKQVLLSVRFRIRGTEKQKIQFSEANMNNEKV